MGQVPAPQSRQTQLNSAGVAVTTSAPRTRTITLRRTPRPAETAWHDRSAARDTRTQEAPLMLQLTLDHTWLAPLRRTLFGAESGLISILRALPDPRDPHRVKVWLGLRRASVRAVMDLIITTLPEAEIGRIAPLTPTAANGLA